MYTPQAKSVLIIPKFSWGILIAIALNLNPELLIAEDLTKTLNVTLQANILDIKSYLRD